MAAFTVHTSTATSSYSPAGTAVLLRTRRRAFPYRVSCSTAAADRTVVIGLAADSGCGKSTFICRLTSVFGGRAEPPRGGNPDSNTLISDTTTVICLDDYHSLDRAGRKAKGVTALDPRADDFDLMYEQVKAIKEGRAVEKPVYNHVTGLLDPPEVITPPKILVIQGLHPMYDERVRNLLDFSIYLDISNEVKFAWKIQVSCVEILDRLRSSSFLAILLCSVLERDMAERGHSLESIKAGIEARKPDFDAYIDPQKQYADAVIEVLPTQLIPDDNEGKVLRVKLIMKEGMEHFSPVYLFDEGSTVSWIPCGRKLSSSYPGIKFACYPDTYFGHDVICPQIISTFQITLLDLLLCALHEVICPLIISTFQITLLDLLLCALHEVTVLEMDGQFDKLDELIYVETHLSNLSTKFYGEVTQQMLEHAHFPESNNGTGLFHNIVGLKIRDLYEQIVAETATAPAKAAA